jgi:hypothetical protein
MFRIEQTSTNRAKTGHERRNAFFLPNERRKELLDPARALLTKPNCRLRAKPANFPIILGCQSPARNHSWRFGALQRDGPGHFVAFRQKLC